MIGSSSNELLHASRGGRQVQLTWIKMATGADVVELKVDFDETSKKPAAGLIRGTVRQGI